MEDQTIWWDGENGALHFVVKTVDKSRRFLWLIPSEGLPFLSTDPRVLNNSFFFPYGARRVRYRNFFFHGRLMHPLLPSTKRQKIPLVSLQLIPILEEACIMEINTRGRFVFAVSDSSGKRTARDQTSRRLLFFSSSSFPFLSFFSFFYVNNYSRLQKSLVYIQKQQRFIVIKYNNGFEGMKSLKFRYISLCTFFLFFFINVTSQQREMKRNYKL